MITAIITAAGESKRMGEPKMILPWGNTTVLGQVIDVLLEIPVEDVIVICGSEREKITTACKGRQVRTVINEEYASGEMLSSVQTGLRAMKREAEAALIVLGDQPQIQESTVRLIIEEYRRTESSLIIPSYKMHRGHPWLVGREWLDEILEMRAGESLREFLQLRASNIDYVELDSPTILMDLDTPEDYLKSRP